MEIIPFLRLSGRRLIVLWVVAGIAGALGAFYAKQLPLRHTGEATVFLERVYPGLRYEREPFVNNYASAVVNLATVHDRVGEKVGLDPAEIEDGLKIEVPSSGDIAYVRFTTENADTATAGAEAVATETLVTLTTETQTAAQAALDRAKAKEVEAQSQVDAITEPLGVHDLGVEYEQVTAQIKELEKQVASVAPTDGSLPNLNSLLDFRRAERARMAEALPAYEQATARLEAVKAETTVAQQEFDAAVARVAVAQNGEAVVPQGATEESATQKMVRFGGAAAILAAVLVLLGVIAIETVNRPRRSNRVQPPAPGGPRHPAQPNGHRPHVANGSPVAAGGVPHAPVPPQH